MFGLTIDDDRRFIILHLAHTSTSKTEMKDEFSWRGINMYGHRNSPKKWKDWLFLHRVEKI